MEKVTCLDDIDLSETSSTELRVVLEKHSSPETKVQDTKTDDVCTCKSNYILQTKSGESYTTKNVSLSKSLNFLARSNVKL